MGIKKLITDITIIQIQVRRMYVNIFEVCSLFSLPKKSSLSFKKESLPIRNSTRGTIRTEDIKIMLQVLGKF